MFDGRRSGLLLHLTSLPGRFGVGTLGRGAKDFIDFLAESGQRYWQILPCGVVSPDFDCSPYMSLSAFAGNSLLIDPELLVAEGLLERKDLADVPDFSEYSVDFDQVIRFNRRIMETAFLAFQSGKSTADFEAFCKTTRWLDDFALFAALHEQFSGKPWNEWPADIAAREPLALARWREQLREPVRYHQFVQFCFYAQWQQLRNYAADNGIALIGDIPIYVAQDSADVWGNQACFRLDSKTGLPTHVAGVPPDYFSETGQRWGNPLFVWQDDAGHDNESLYSWWADRLLHSFHTVDLIRIDHFRGFESYWEIAADEATAINGRWVPGPGHHFFDEMKKRVGELPIIAEDLGIITPEVERLRDDLGFPGMKILQFAFDSDEHNAYLPHNYKSSNCVVYTGTHDNDTTVGWFLSDRADQASKDRVMRYAHSRIGAPVHWDFIRMAYSSVAALAVIPLQDVLGFGSDCRMNMPSTSQGNWRWRCAPRFLTPELAARLKDEVIFYNRLPG
ncbi:MAG: 4-alpha-glucanotransferase [Desulfobulbaceae bacterium]|nr:4-alpha-glucanotransferase [Desulfobulbaceae bacterium]HIJ79984.1 4-alpha-glucanotransferase [Deltaproteobacteria bacterium]